MPHIELAEISSLSLEEKILVWSNRVDNYQIDNKPDKDQTEKLLTEGCGLFFDILEPFKDSKWIQAKHPDIHHKVYIDSENDKIVEFSELFGKDFGVVLNDTWGVEIYDYRKQFYGDDIEASIKLTCAQQGTHGKKLIRVLYSPPRKDSSFGPHGQIYIEDTTVSWLRRGANGKLETVDEKNLYDYSGLSICKLAVALAEGFAKEHTKKQQAQAPQPA